MTAVGPEPGRGAGAPASREVSPREFPSMRLPETRKVAPSPFFHSARTMERARCQRCTFRSLDRSSRGERWSDPPAFAWAVANGRSNVIDWPERPPKSIIDRYGAIRDGSYSKEAAAHLRHHAIRLGQPLIPPAPAELERDKVIGLARVEAYGRVPPRWHVADGVLDHRDLAQRAVPGQTGEEFGRYRRRFARSYCRPSLSPGSRRPSSRSCPSPPYPDPGRTEKTPPPGTPTERSLA